jgi:DNA-binding CsgD family transcriptional regulator
MEASTSRRIVRLAQDAAEAPPVQIEDALLHVLDRLTAWIGASNAFWVGAVREQAPRSGDPLLGWRSRDLVYLSDHDCLLAGSADMVARIHAGDVDAVTAANVSGAGRTRALLRREVISDEDWRRSWIVHEYQRPRGVYEQLVSTHALTPRHECHVGLTRGRHDRPFGLRERDLLLLFQSASRQLHRRVMFFRGLGGARALTPREREVLRLLATDRTEREIAAALRLGARTVHQHALSIYGKLGVRGRLGLLSLLGAGTMLEGSRASA